MGDAQEIFDDDTKNADDQKNQAEYDEKAEQVDVARVGQPLGQEFGWITIVGIGGIVTGKDADNRGDLFDQTPENSPDQTKTRNYDHYNIKYCHGDRLFHYINPHFGGG
jgi:hypothetical protein